MHETIHWWQHVGSNFGFISSLKYPAQAHIVHKVLKEFLIEVGPFKSIANFNKLHQNKDNQQANEILNYWHDIEYAGIISFDPRFITRITEEPYFESWGHSYHLMWASSIRTLASTFDQEFSFLPDIRNWDKGFTDLRDRKVESFYYRSPNTICSIGAGAIYEGQARLSQLQYLYGASGGKMSMSYFSAEHLLDDIYGKALNLFLSILNEPMPEWVDDPLIGLFLLLCDIAINPTDGFPHGIIHYESFIISNDPGYRFVFMCQMIRDKHSDLKRSIVNYSREEYIEISEILCDSICCISPFFSAAYCRLIAFRTRLI